MKKWQMHPRCSRPSVRSQAPSDQRCFVGIMTAVSAGSAEVYGDGALMHGMNISFLCMAAGALVLLLISIFGCEREMINLDLPGSQGLNKGADASHPSALNTSFDILLPGFRTLYSIAGSPANPALHIRMMGYFG